VQRFILQENIRRFQARLGELKDAGDRRRVEEMLAAVERELALLDASEAGVLASTSRAEPDENAALDRALAITRFREEFSGATRIAALIDPAPGLAYVEVNPAYEQSLGVGRDDLVGRGLFQLFPDNPDDSAADGVYKVYMSLRQVAETARPHDMPVQRYDVAGDDGVFVQRYWRITNAPILNDQGRLVLILNTAEETIGTESWGDAVQPST